jgi:hypothetical protein
LHYTIIKAIKKLLTISTIVLISIWVSLSILRLVVGYELFEVAEVFQLKSNLSQTEAMLSINKYITLGIYSNITYVLTFIAMLFLYFVNKGKLKIRGWVLMSIILYILFLPSEIYLILNDIDMYYYLSSFTDMTKGKFDGVVHIFKMRFLSDIFKTLVPMSIMSHLAIVLFLIFKPLDKNES